MVVLHGFLELSESSIHFSNVSGRFLSISDEVGGDYEVIVADYPAGLFFLLEHGFEGTNSWNHHLIHYKSLYTQYSNALTAWLLERRGVIRRLV